MSLICAAELEDEAERKMSSSSAERLLQAFPHHLVSPEQTKFGNLLLANVLNVFAVRDASAYDPTCGGSNERCMFDLQIYFCLSLLRGAGVGAHSSELSPVPHRTCSSAGRLLPRVELVGTAPRRSGWKSLLLCICREESSQASNGKVPASSTSALFVTFCRLS